MSAVKPLPMIDGLLAATAKMNKLILVTRNIKDIQHLKVHWFNPFEGEASNPEYFLLKS